MRTIRAYARRLVAWWRAADDVARSAGVTWYKAARKIARRLARAHGCTVATAAGVIAALSPRLTWSYNVIAADAVLAKADNVPGVFKANLKKARSIAIGVHPLKVLSGPKVRAFYRALMGDESAAVVDTWILQAVGLTSKGVTPQSYAQVAAALRMGAHEVGATTSAFQAVTWVAIRGRA